MAQKRSPSAAMSNSRPSKRSRRGRCYFDTNGFDENLVYEILFRLPVLDLLAAKECCRSWNDISTCKEFRALYDHKSNNDSMVIGFNSSTNSFPLFQISVKGGNYMRRWDFALNRQIVGENSEWMLVGSYKSLLLFKEKEVIKFCVVNPFTREYRLIPEPLTDSMVNEEKTWRMRFVHMIVSGCSDETLKLLVFVVSDPSQSCFSMVYDSLYGWKEYNISQHYRRLQFGRIAEGVCFNGKKAIQIVYPSLFSYDTETSVLATRNIEFDDSVLAHQNIESEHQNTESEHQNTESDDSDLASQNIEFDVRVIGLGVFEYQNNMYFLDAATLSDRATANLSKIRIWMGDSMVGKWTLVMLIDLVLVFGKSISCESVACYDQERYVSVFPRDGPRMILVDLHSKSFRILGFNPVTLIWNRNSCLPRGDLRAFPIKPSFNCFLK